MTKQTKITTEVFLYSLIFILAAFVRLILLGKTPLTESEASWAYQAWQIWKGESIQLGSIVSYLSITEGLFSIFGSGNFIARFWPALAGSLLIWVPYLSRDQLGRIPALVMGLGLALDPALVSISRVAGSAIPALVFLLLTGIMFHNFKFAWSLAFLFMGILSGPGFWLGIAILGIALALASSLKYLDLISYFKVRFQGAESRVNKPNSSTVDLLFPVLVVLVVGTFFFSQPVGLSSWAAALPEFFQGWAHPPRVSLVKVFSALLINNPLILLFGVLGFISAWLKNDQPGKINSLWFATALILILVYPGRQTADLIWVVIPLWVATARELVHLYDLHESKWFTTSLSGLIVILFVLNWLTFVGMIFQGDNQRAILLQWGLIAASLALAVVAMSIVASEWGWPAAKKSLAVGVAGVLAIYVISSMTQGAYLRTGDPRSLWTDGSGFGQMELLTETINEISVSETGRRDSIEGVSVNGSPALLWALRDMKNFQNYEIYDPDLLAPLIISREFENFTLPDDLYRGQDFILSTRSNWNGVFPDNWISWIAFREGPLLNEDIILWVRNDVMSGN